MSDDDQLTACRDELKFLVRQARVQELRERVGRLLPAHHFAAGSPLSPLAHHYTTTVYFDTASGDLYRDAVRAIDHTKLRAREYYDVVPMAELATDERELFRASPLLWIELKDRSGDRSSKRRLGVPKRSLKRFLEHPSADPELLDIQTSAHGPEGRAVLERLIEFISRYTEPLHPSAIVNYRRSAWQDGSTTTRVTLDEELSTYVPQDSLWAEELPLTRHALGTPIHVEERTIVEVKCLGPLPHGLLEALIACDAEAIKYSKFVAASEAVHAHRASAQAPVHGAASG